MEADEDDSRLAGSALRVAGRGRWRESGGKQRDYSRQVAGRRIAKETRHGSCLWFGAAVSAARQQFGRARRARPLPISERRRWPRSG
jgi:hypothetical protein